MALDNVPMPEMRTVGVHCLGRVQNPKECGRLRRDDLWPKREVAESEVHPEREAADLLNRPSPPSGYAFLCRGIAGKTVKRIIQKLAVVATKLRPRSRTPRDGHPRGRRGQRCVLGKLAR